MPAPIEKKEMVVTGDSLTFSNAPQTDAEGQVAVRRFTTNVPAGAQGQGGVGAAIDGQLGSMPGIVEYRSNVGDMANAVRTACIACRHFDRRAWHKFLSAATGPASSAENRATIHGMKGRIAMAGYGVRFDNGELDVDATVLRHGICHVLSDWVEGAVGRDPMHWPVVPDSDATCPTYVAAGPHRMEVTTPAQPFGLFQPKDLDAKNIGAARYDAVLFDAANKSR